MNNFQNFAILIARAGAIGMAANLVANMAIAAVSNLSDYKVSDRDPSSQIQQLRGQQVAEKSDRNLSSSKGTLKEGSILTIDSDKVIGIPKAEARRRFILNKIYRVQEGTAADDLFIVDEKANKWAVEDVSDATMGSVTHSVALIISGNGRVWALIQKF